MSKITNKCRICLIQTEKTKTTRLNKKQIRYIEDISGIKLKIMPDFPNRICEGCFRMLETSIKFRELCRASEQILQVDLNLEPVIKTEFIHNDNDSGDQFFENFVDCSEVEKITEIADFSMDDLDMPKPMSESSDENTLKAGKTILLPKIKQKKAKAADAQETEAQKQPQKFTSNKGRKRDEDSNGNAIMCEICGNIYKQKNLLNMHMRRHLEFKPYDCEICAKSFACASEIRRHMRTHTGEKPYTCKFCARSFADRSTHIKHERTHTNTRPFQCTTCGKSFTYSNVLKNHMLTHTGEKNFHCLPCNKTFSRKHQLDQHCATITHQQTIRALDVGNAVEMPQNIENGDIIIDNKFILKLIPKAEDAFVPS